jgi:hypothetical protein
MRKIRILTCRAGQGQRRFTAAPRFRALSAGAQRKGHPNPENIIHRDPGKSRKDAKMLTYKSPAAIPMTNLALALFAWLTCGIAAAGLWNASLYSVFRNCGRQGAEDQARFLIKGAIGGPLSLVLALAETNFGEAGWSLSTHECAQRVKPNSFGIPAERLPRPDSSKF